MAGQFEIMNTFNVAAIVLQILAIDLVLAGDNVIVIGLAVAQLRPDQRRIAILAGVIGATIIRVAFALVAMKLLAIIGLTLAGGLLLLWVVWKSARELLAFRQAGGTNALAPASMGAAILRIVVADVSMSLDNVLAVAGAARNHPILLGLGLVVSVGLMGIAAGTVARIMQRFPWVAWIGIAIVFYVAMCMIREGWYQVAPYLATRAY